MAATGPTASLAPGAVVEKMRIDRILGQGAFAVTYLVTDQTLNESFALKEYLPHDRVLRSEDGKLRPADGQEAAFSAGLSLFLDEGRTIARLDHPHIVKVLRCFESNGTAYMLMPWYRGEALHKLLRRGGTFSLDEALALARPLLNALNYIHQKGVYHRDIKPANIYITHNGDPLLLDFGAAGQCVADSENGRPRLGSEGYAAPEQSEPDGSIGPWTDIYSLAATLYRCISGRIPTPASRRLRALRQGNADPLPPLGQLVPDLAHAPVVDAIGQGLAIDQAARPQTASQWRHAFGGKGEHAGAEGRIEQEGREWLPMILMGILGIVLLTAVTYLLTGRQAEQQAPTTAIEPAQSKVEPGVDRSRHTSPEETARWQAALDADTAFGYQQFMGDYPESIHTDQAKVHLERLDHQAWGYARAQGTKAAIEDYLANFPGGHHEAEAGLLMHEFERAEQVAERERLEEEKQDNEDWEKARSSRTIAAMDEYLATRPGGLHADEARDLRRRIADELNEIRAFEAARKLNTIEAWQSYVDAFPKGQNIATALEAIDALTLRPGKMFRDCPECPTMVVVPAGSYWQGSEESSPHALKMETPRRMVTIADPFAAGVFEITFEQWDLCVAEGGCSTKPVDNGWGRGSRPVIMVSWNDAQEFTAWLSKKTGQSYSLPSESQWEYLARAGEESDWLGGDPTQVCEFGNIAGGESGFRWQHADCSDQAALETRPVGSFLPNAFGVHDVVGNVAEWTLDCMNLSYLDAPADGSAWGRGICSSRMTRGGSWFTGTREVRLPARFNLKNGDRNDFTGFRVVRRVEEG